jgi:hypothetical protein
MRRLSFRPIPQKDRTTLFHKLAEFARRQTVARTVGRQNFHEFYDLLARFFRNFPTITSESLRFSGHFPEIPCIQWHFS